MKNLPSFLLLVGYSGYKACFTPYILFKLEEVKKSEAVSVTQNANGFLVVLVLSLFFTLRIKSSC